MDSIIFILFKLFFFVNNFEKILGLKKYFFYIKLRYFFRNKYRRLFNFFLLFINNWVSIKYLFIINIFRIYI